MITITYIEGEQRNHFTMEQFAVLLRASGLDNELHIYSTGTSALRDIPRQLPPTIILLDLKLKDIPAGELIKRLRRFRQTQNTPIIGVAPYSLISGRHPAIDTGCDRVIVKPLRYAAIEKTLFQYVART